MLIFVIYDGLHYGALIFKNNFDVWLLSLVNMHLLKIGFGLMDKIVNEFGSNNNNENQE